jgi:asparagine synthase (glutamine-hydrolysing)
LLRAAVGDLLPHDAPKHGFVFPLARWLRGDLAPLVERLLAPERLREQGLFRPDYPYASLDAERLWPLVMFQLWHLLYVEEALEGPPTFGWADVAGSTNFRNFGKSATISS